MKSWTPLQTLAKVHRGVWWNIRLLGALQAQLDNNSPTFNDCVEIEKVLRAAVAEVERVIHRERDEERNQWNLRQAREFALKASVAKAGEAVPAHRQLCPDDQSHK